MQDGSFGDHFHRQCTRRISYLPKGICLTMGVVGSSPDPTTVVHFSEQETESGYGARQSVEMATTSIHYTPGDGMVVEMSQELLTYLEPLRYDPGLWAQPYEYELSQPAQNLDGLPPIAQELTFPFANGYAPIHERPSELESPGSFFLRCAIYRGGPTADLTTISARNRSK